MQFGTEKHIFIGYENQSAQCFFAEELDLEAEKGLK